MAFPQNILKFSKQCTSFYEYSKNISIQNLLFLTSVRGNKHWNPKYKWFRYKKVIPVNLPKNEKNEKPTKETKEKIRSHLKHLGIFPPPYYKSRPLTITTATEIIDPYDPPKGDGKTSFLSPKITSTAVDTLKKNTKTRLALKKIKTYESDFSANFFAQQAQDIYIKAHSLLMKKDPEELSEYVTDRAIPQMLDGLNNKTIKWKFIKSLEPPIVVQARTSSVVKETNLFAQLTVRFHTQQSLAVYDRFGRLCYGSEILAKDVLEFVVFEKHINNVYGVWKLHAKIIPEWAPPSENTLRTFSTINETERSNDGDDDDDEDIDELSRFLNTEDNLEKPDEKILQKDKA